MPWRAKKRESALRLPGIRRLCSTETISFNVKSRCSRIRARICCEYFSNGEVLPPRGIGSQTPSSRKSCTQRIAELALTWNCSAASRRDPPPSTKRITRTLSSPGYGPRIAQPPANQCVRLAPSEPFGNPDSLRLGRAVNALRGCHIAAQPAFARLRTEIRELVVRNRRADARHQLLVVSHIDRREQDAAEDLVRFHQVVKVRARIVARRRTAAGFVEGTRIVRVARVLEVDPPKSRKGEPMAAVAGREHAVEHVNAARHRRENIFGRSHTHEVARTVDRKH